MEQHPVSNDPGTMARISMLFVVLLTIIGTTFAEETATGRVDCMFTSIAMTRPDEYASGIEDIPVEYCTHIIYSHIELEPSTLTLRPENFEYDILQNGWERFIDLKKTNPKLKLLMSIKSVHTSTLIKTAAQRTKFISLIVSFLKKFKFDGISILWMGYYDEDPEEASLDKLFKEMRQSFDAAGHPDWEANLMISIDQTDTDHSRICKVADTISLMGFFDYVFDPSNTKVVAPLNNVFLESGESQNISIKHSLQTWLNNGCPADKVLLGFSFMAVNFILEDPKKNGPGAPATEHGKPCSITDSAGACAYFELCQKFNETGRTFKWDDAGASPYTFRDYQWSSYENEASIQRKASFARSKGLAGVFGMTLGSDDYRGKCGEAYPLTKALWKGFQLETNALN